MWDIAAVIVLSMFEVDINTLDNDANDDVRRALACCLVTLAFELVAALLLLLTNMTQHQ